MSNLQFINVFRHRTLIPHQISALQWLNNNLPYNIRKKFTLIWRQINWFEGLIIETSNFVDFTRVSAFYRNLPHQNKAIQYLQDSCPPQTLLDFTTKWRKTPPAPISPPSPLLSLPAPNLANVSKRLSNEDFQRAARILGNGVTAAHIRAVVEVECKGSGFQSDGRPIILYEAHIFACLTNNRFNSSHPNLSSKTWNSRLYTLNEWRRLEAAMLLNHPAALRSCSWGIGQVLGDNFSMCGYNSISPFVNDMFLSESKQLDIMMAFIKAAGLARPLANNDWAAFAKGYNGPGFKANNYHTKLRNAFLRFNR